MCNRNHSRKAEAGGNISETRKHKGVPGLNRARYGHKEIARLLYNFEEGRGNHLSNHFWECPTGIKRNMRERCTLLAWHCSRGLYPLTSHA